MPHPSKFILLLLLIPTLFAQTTTPATQPTTATEPAAASQPHPIVTKDKPVYFTTMQSILLNTPPALRPQATEEWSKFSEYKFIAWWEKQLVGLKIDQSIPITSCDVSRTSKEPGKEWQVTLHFDSIEFPYFGSKHAWFIGYQSIRVDEATAEKWDFVKKGTFVPVKAGISNVTIGKKNYRVTDLPQYSIKVELTDLVISLPK